MGLRPAPVRTAAARVERRNAARNRETRDAWAAFAGHREHVTVLVEFLAPRDRPGRLGVLGAGNANDLDLGRLLGRYGAVHLVDLDGEALAAGVARQAVAPGRVTLHGGVDLTGIAERVDRWAARPPDADAIDAAVRALGAPLDLSPAGAPFDTVVSTCLLTQLIDACVWVLGPDHPRLAELAVAVRDHHLRTLVRSARAGGRALLISDMTSSDTAPDLLRVPPAGVPELAVGLIAQGNFFTGTNPIAVRESVLSQPDLARRVAGLTLHRPWRWDLGARSYLVYALSVRCR